MGLCTVSSISLDRVLLKHGVPTKSKFGGLLELRDGRPTRFAEVIHYDGSSIDPLEVFVRSGMTDCCGAIRDGNGVIGASFCEMPADSRELVLDLGDQLSAVGLGVATEVGLPGQSVLGVPVNEGRIGAIVLSDLNPVSIREIPGHISALRPFFGLVEYARLFSSEDLPAALDQHV